MAITIGRQWFARRDEIRDFILHDGWLQADVAEYFGISREYARCVIDQLGIPYSRQRVVHLWCPWTPPWHPCAGQDCDRMIWKAGVGHGLCTRCSAKKRYAENEDYRAKQAVLVRRWQRENPRNKADCDGRAQKARKARHIAKGWCVQCKRPLVTMTLCEYHRQKEIARYNTLKESRQTTP